MYEIKKEDIVMCHHVLTFSTANVVVFLFFSLPTEKSVGLSYNILNTIVTNAVKNSYVLGISVCWIR